MELDAFIAQLDKSGGGAPEWAIAAYEQSIGAPLPADYRTFLEKCNGGLASELLCRYETDVTKVPPSFAQLGMRSKQTRTAEFDIYHVFGFREEEWLSIEHRNELLRGQIPPSVIWMFDCFDACGTICLGVKDPHVGKVFFWDRDGIYPEGLDENIYEFDVVASSFNEFISLIQRAN